MPTISKGSGPIILDKGSAITIVASTGAAGSISIPGEAVAQSVTSGTKYSYGPFTDRREVIIALTNGTAEVTIGSVASAAFTDAEVQSLQAVVSGAWNTLPEGITLPAGLTLAQSLPKTRKALARSRSGGADVVHLVMGDSTTMGDGAGTGTNGFVGARNRSLAQCLAREVGGVRYPTSSDSFMGNQLLTGVTMAQYDPRLNLGAWAPDNTLIKTLGGYIFKAASSGATLAFTPVGIFDSFDLYTVGYNGGGQVTVNVDGGSTLATWTDSASGVFKTTVSCARGTHTINIVTTNATAVYVHGVICHDSQRPAINVLQCGQSGDNLGQFVNNVGVYNVYGMLTAIAPDIITLNFNINDMRVPTAEATYRANYQKLIDACKVLGDVVLTFSHYVDTAQASQATQEAYKGYVQSLAASNGLIFVDRSVTTGATYAIANAAGYMYDALHPNALGYGAQAALESALWAALV